MFIWTGSGFILFYQKNKFAEEDRKAFNSITDIIRATVIVNKSQPEQVIEVYDKLNELKKLKIIRIKEKLESLQNVTINAIFNN